MSIEGRIAIDVAFSDTTSDTGVQSLKRLALTSTDAYTSGKVAIIAGTCGTANVSVTLGPSVYLDASGSAVSFTSISRYAFACSRAAKCYDFIGAVAFSDGSRVSVTDTANTSPIALTIDPQFTSGTASYSLVVVGT